VHRQKVRTVCGSRLGAVYFSQGNPIVAANGSDGYKNKILPNDSFSAIQTH